MPEFIDLTGQNFGNWLVISRTEDHISKSGYHFTQFLCECQCDLHTRRNVLASALKSGRSKSCGCNKEVARTTCGNNFRTHGETKTRLYQIYAGMKKRCYNPKAYNFKNYGGRGIKICDEWLGSWEAFRDWSKDNGYDDTLSIDRIDVNGNYEPDNCQWVGSVAQANNRRTSRIISYNGISHTVAEWAKILELPYKQFHKKLQKGMSISEIMAG